MKHLKKIINVLFLYKKSNWTPVSGYNNHKKILSQETAWITTNNIADMMVFYKKKLKITPKEKKLIEEYQRDKDSKKFGL